MSVNIYSSTVPHRYRNRFLRDGGSNISIIGGGSSSSSSSSGGFTFEPHYLWGQYFDDTQDISGDLTGVGSITASGVINASGITLSDFVIAPTVSGTNAVFDTGVFYSGITSNSAIINNISGDTVVLSQSLTAPNISGNSIIGKNISGTNASITSLTATAITSNTINVTNKLTTNQLEAVSGYIKTLLSDEITVDYLTVTKAAHFFKLLIDEIKATQGQIIITPCNAVIDKVETVSGNYRCYFRAKDDDREIYNNFEVNDQVVCQTFNVATGVSYNVSNTYYWRLCVATGTTSTTIDGETVECHYIDLSNTDKDSYSNSAPAKGDNVVQLGNRNDTTRQAAIIISAYNQQFLDPTIKAPSIVQYQGINDYSLQNHRKNVISKDFNEFVGNFKTSTGDDIEELIEDVTSGITAYLHTAWANSADGSVDFTKNPSGGSYAYVGFCSNNTQSDTNLVYSDYSWSYVKGADGTNGTNGTDGTDGVDGISITGVTEYYLISSSSANVTTATTGWQTTFIAPTPQKKYLWNYEENHFSDGTTAKTIPVIIGNYATDGTNGTNGTNGEDGRGISSITEYYLATSASGNVTTATTGWSTTVQKMTSTKKYLWNYELITYTDNTTSKTEPVIIGVYGDKGNKGDSGTSVTVSSTSITYAVTTSSTQPNDSEFTYNSIPSLSTGDFLWCKTVVNYSNGTTTKSYSVSRIGADGTNGTNGTNGTDGVDSYLHIAYALSANGSSGFSTTYFNGALYIGTCTNSTQSDPQTYTSYTWARLKGEKGDSGTSVTITATSITYAVTTNSTQPADNKFTYSSIPTVAVGNYLWCKTIVSYSNGTSTKSYSVSRVGADGTNGTNGTNGTDGKDSYLHIAYALSANGSSGFSTTYFAGALYIGTCTNDSATDPQTYTSYTWARLRGEDGEDGQSGTSISISSTSVTYAVTTTATQPTDNKFTYTSIPTVAKGSYLWTKTIVTYSDGSFTKTYTVSYKGIDGNDGTSITISSTSVTYAVTTANTQPSDSEFTATTVPTVPKGSYLWTKTVVTYSDGTVTKTYSVSYKGTDGDKGDTGDDAEFYRLVPVIEKAIVDKNGTLGVQFSYQIAHVSGSSVTTVTATTSGYWVRVKPNNTNTYYNLSTNTTTPNYTNTSFITNYHKQTSKPTYFTVYLVSGSSAVVKDQKTVSVIFDAGATLEVTDEINATVQGHSETISSHTNSIATLNANYNSITTTVQSNTNNISNLSGTVTSHTNSISQLQQTSSSLTSTVSAHTNQINSISGTVTGHTSQISTIQQNLTGITSTVASLEDTVDNLSVGGTNLIRETKYLDTDYCYVNGTRTKNGYQSFTYAYKYKYSSDGDYVDVLGWSEKLTLEPNTWYTLSFYAKGSGQIKSFLYPNAVVSGYNSSNNTTTGSDGMIETNYTTSWKRYWITWKTASSVSGSKSLLVARLYSGYVYIAAPKFEKGTMATDWSPHPEDFESDINAISGTVTSHTASISQLQQTSSSLTSTVSSHTQSISQLQQTSTSLTSTVQSLQNTVSQIELTKKVTVDATSLSENYCYPVVISFGGDNTSKPIRCNVSRTLINSYGVPSYGIHTNGFSIDVDWTTKASGWGTNRVNEYWSTSDDTRYISDYKSHWVTYNGIQNNPLTPIVGSIGQVIEKSEEIVYVRGGSKYDISTSYSNATITLYSGGYNWSRNGYSGSRPIISYSSLVIPVQDARTYSEIVQTATNIELNVYDELKNKTGINVSAGTITLDADNTTIVGNLNLTDTNNGLTMYDNESVPRVNIQPTKIGTYAIGKYGWYTASKTETGHSNFYLDLNAVSLGSISSGYDIAIYYANINMWATSGSSTTYPYSYPRLRTQIYCNGTLVKDFGYTGVTWSSTGIFYVNTPMIYTTKSAGTYTVKFTLSSTTTVNTSYSVYGMVNANIQWDLKAQTQIFTDGMLSQSAPNNYVEVKPDRVEMRQGTIGLRLISDTNNPSGNMFKGIQTIVGFRGSTPDVYPTWLPFHNFIPTFSCGDGKRNFTYQKITNINQYKYAYQISPYNDYGIMIINSPAYDSSLNKQETWVMLPPLNFSGEKGTNNMLPVGYTITIINNTFGDNATGVYVVPSVSSQSTGMIIDSHRDTQYYSSINGNQTCDTYIYVGTWSNGTNNIMYWRSIHDTQ